VAGVLEPNMAASMMAMASLVNYDNWAIRITKANINLEGLTIIFSFEVAM
jgi:hypothetical protein